MPWSEGNEKFLSVNNCRIFVKALGKSDHKLIVIHGGPDWDHSYLIPAFKNLSQQIEVILFDMRGCGKSQRFSESKCYSKELVVQDLLALCDALKLEKVSLLGFSFGGQIAMQFALNYPGRVNQLILASTTAFNDFQSDLDKWDEYRKRRTTALKQRIGFLFKEVSDPKLASKTLAYESIALDIYNEEKMEEARKIFNNITFSGEWMTAYRSGLLTQQKCIAYGNLLEGIESPLHIIHGEKDMRFPVSVARKLNQRIKNSKLHVLGRAGHLAFIDQPRKWDRALCEVFAINRGSPSFSSVQSKLHEKTLKGAES